MKTISERLRDKIGDKVECSQCLVKSELNENWLINKYREPICPKCQPQVLRVGELLVSF